jgi:hypothetical protein
VVGHGCPWQRFLFRPAEGGFQRIVTATLGREFEPQGGSWDPGAFIVNTGISGYDGAAKQQWAVQGLSAPGIATGLRASFNYSGGIALTWNPVVGATGYVVKRSATSGGPYTVLATGVTAAAFTDTTAQAEVDYYYVVSSLAGSAENLDSAEAAAPRFRAWLRFDENSGTIAADSSAHGWNGSLINGPLWTTGRFGNAVGLDGSNDHVTLPTGVVSGLTDFTISAWVRLDTIGTWSRVFDFGSGTSNYLFFTAAGPGGAPRFAIRTPSVGEQVIDGSAPLSAGAWTHLALTLPGTTGTLYVNGNAVGSNRRISLDPSDLGNTTANFIGKSQWADPYLDGLVDDFRIYGSALKSAEIVALASQTEPSSLPVTDEELRAPLLVMGAGVASITAIKSVAGHSYQLQYGDSLLGDSWINHGAPQAGTGAGLSFVVPIPSQVPQRFYRLLIEP